MARRPLARLLLPFSLALLAGCGGESPSSRVTSSSSRTLTAATADDVKSLDPALAFDTWSTAVVHATTRRLVDYDMEAKIVPDLAEKWEEADGGKTFTFHLRSGARFADGTPIEASRFAAELKRVQDPKTASPGASFYRGLVSVTAPDSHTLVVKLKAPDPTLLNLMGMTFAAPLHPKWTGAGLPVGSGAYTVEAYEPGSRVTLARSAYDSRGLAGVERLVVQLRVEEPLQLTRFNNGEVDLLPAVPLPEMARVMNDPAEKQRVVQGVVNQTWYFGMNLTRPPFDNPKVRRAAMLALDRERHAQLAGAGRTANGILPPHVPGYDPDRKLPERNPSEAKRLLAEAGFPDGIPEAQKAVLWLAANERYQRHAEAIQADLKAVGIPVELRSVTLSEYLSAYRTKADCWYGGWYPDFPDAGNFLEPVFTPGSSSNAAHYNNSELAAILARAHGAPTGAARSALYRRAEDLLLQDLPWVPLYFEVETRYFRPGVTGVAVHPVWRQMLTGIGKS